VVLQGHVFIGGYFYDVRHGPYPWWSRTAYPRWYSPVYDRFADLRLEVKPRDAAVYVDGFYAGIVDDFDGIFQRLHVAPGGHTVVIYLEGYRTARHNVYLRPGTTIDIHNLLERLPAGVASEPPTLNLPVPPPPEGTYRLPRTPPPASAPHVDEGTVPAYAVGSGTLDLRVQPPGAEVTIDGQKWVSSEEGHFLVQVPVGKHRVEVAKPGYRGFATDIDVRASETAPLNVSLMTIAP
jgi:hypothetical protein